MASTAPGSWRHLAVRFFESLASRPLEPGERAQVAQWASSGELELFWAQPAIDQRHGYESALRAQSRRPQRRDLVRAALLHDVAKRHARMGIPARVAASVVLRLGLPARGRVAIYRDHGPIAAAELARLGAEPLVIAFAHAHHGDRPSAISVEDWRLLQEADET